MNTKKFFALLLISILSLVSCQTPRYASGFNKDLFLLTPIEANDFIRRQGFKSPAAQLVIYENRPVWLIQAVEDNLLVEIYGNRYFIPLDNAILSVPTTDDLILYHGNVLNVRKNNNILWLELEK